MTWMAIISNEQRERERERERERVKEGGGRTVNKVVNTNYPISLLPHSMV